MGCDWSICQNLNIWDVLNELGTDEAVLYEDGELEEGCRCYYVFGSC